MSCRVFFVKRCHVILVLLTATFISVIFMTVQKELKIGSTIPLDVDNHARNKEMPPITDGTDIKALAIEDRRHRIEDICGRIGSVSQSALEITGNTRYNISYCVVPKTGCTVWERLFKYLAGQKQTSGNPMSISKFEVHYRERQYYHKYNLDHGADFAFIKNSLRLTTVRDPFTRLWSAYIDKLLLPDFWNTKGRQIIKSTRLRPSSVALKCGHDVTFPEFIQYVIRTGHQFTYIHQDNHWLPASDICDPCIFKPNIISKQETFMSDFSFILNKIGLNTLLTKLKLKDPVEFEIKDEINYNFNILHYHSKCMDTLGLCKRMWLAFTLNGYIPPKTQFPAYHGKEIFNSASFYKMVQRIRERYNVTKLDTQTYRRQALTRAFSQISQNDINALKELYKMDFELFNYARDPEYIRR